MNTSVKADPATSRIFIVDDHPLVRSGLKALLEREPRLEVCGEAEDVAGALAAITTMAAMADSRPHLVLIDITLKQSNGLELVKEIGAKHPEVRILVISMHDEALYAVRALKAGAHGYIMKREANDCIVAAIRSVLEGHIYLSDAMTRSAVDQFGRGAAASSPTDLLSDRELELFQLTGRGKEIAEIARIMSISPRTVEVHRSHIKKKLQLKTGTEIFQSAYEWLRESGLRP